MSNKFETFVWNSLSKSTTIETSDACVLLCLVFDMEFTKIGQWKQQNDVYQESVICDDKLWLFGKKFLDQPTFHWGHYAVFGGGMFDYFDLISGQWGQSQSFQPVSIKENRDEIVFVFGTRIFLLLFVNFGAFNVDSLHCFDMVKGEWNKIADFKKNNTISEGCASTNATQRNSLIIVKVISNGRPLECYN
uniref:Uncharacterized protein n=1 Tax=Globodera rostochiensis TaxID=31243 RepID=A0A914IHF8_GLORO